MSISDIYKVPNVISRIIKKNIDVICCVLFICWCWASFQYFFNYDSFYAPNALIIDHYINFPVMAWVFLMGYYSSMKPWGKLTVIAFTLSLLINTYQLHYQFLEFTYFVAWMGIIFALVFVGYIWHIKMFFNQLFNPNYY